MRLGIVRGQVVLSVGVPELLGTTLLLVEPVTAANLASRNGAGGGRPLVVADRLAAGVGEMIGIVEGSEAANAYHPRVAPVDAYCALIVRDYDFRPPADDAKLELRATSGGPLRATSGDTLRATSADALRATSGGALRGTPGAEGQR